MANYTKATNFATKDSLLTGNPSKLIRGTEIDSEFNLISTAISTKADTNSPTFTGTPLAPTAPTSTNSQQIATTEFVTNKISAISSGVVSFSGGTTGLTPSTATAGAVTLAGTLSAANGGTGRTTLTANNLLLGNGTGQVGLVAPSTSGNVLTSNGTTWTSSAPVGIGIGQTWQNVLASRASGTTYTNSTGKPIMVNVGMTATGVNTSGISATVGGVTVVDFLTRGDTSWPIKHTASFIVPNGVSYVVTVTASSLNFWSELR